MVDRREREPVWTEPILTRDEAPLTKTVILKPVGKQGIKTFTNRVVYSAIKEMGYHRQGRNDGAVS